jgi:adenylate kinase
MVLQIDVSRDLLVERATLRRTDKRTGQIYHLKYNPPPPEAGLGRRVDAQAGRGRTRLVGYDDVWAALWPDDAAQGVVTRVAGEGKPEEVTIRLLEALGV